MYGADAVAGVVNFIMDTNFTGIRFDGQYSIYQHNNDDPSASARGLHGLRDILNAQDGYRAIPEGQRRRRRAFDGTVSIGAGFDDGRGHAMAYFGYRKVKPVLQGRARLQRLRHPEHAAAARSDVCGGSATANPGNAVSSTSTTSRSRRTSTIGALGPGTITPVPTNLYNFAPLNYFQRPDERYIAGVFADYEINAGDQAVP